MTYILRPPCSPLSPTLQPSRPTNESLPRKTGADRPDMSFNVESGLSLTVTRREIPDDFSGSAGANNSRSSRLGDWRKVSSIRRDSRISPRLKLLYTPSYNFTTHWSVFFTGDGTESPYQKQGHSNPSPPVPSELRDWRGTQDSRPSIRDATVRRRRVRGRSRPVPNLVLSRR